VIVEGERGEGPDPATTSATVTVIPVDESLPASTDVAEAVDSASGTVVQRLGGLGDWSAVSIRGSSPRQVLVALDGVPLNPDGATVVNLSELPLRSFSRVEVYRGSAPPALASSAMGGVVNLVTPEGPRPSAAALGAGTLRSARFHVDAAPAGALGPTPVQGFLSVDGFSTAGSFRYFDDQRTPYNLGDDRLRVRENNETHQLSVLGRVRAGEDGLRFTFLDSLLVRQEGVPGPISTPTASVAYGVVRNLAVAEVDGSGGAVSWKGRLWGQLREERFDDREGEVGVGRQWTRDTTVAVGTSGHLGWAPSAHVVTGVTSVVRFDRYLGRDRLEDQVQRPRHRWSTTLSANATFRAWEDRLVAQPVLQGVALHSFDADPASGGGSASTVAFTPRVGLLVRPMEGLAVKANAGRYLRPPDFLELFGDRGAFRGQADLRPEQGWQADLGVRWTPPTSGGLSGSLEVTGFHVSSRDLIAYVQNGQQVVIPVNLGSARVRGVEGALSLHAFGWVEVQTNLTHTGSVNLSPEDAYSGNQLPRIPSWELYQRTALTPGERVRVGHAFSFTGADYWDATNWYRSAPRAIHGLFAKLSVTPALSVEMDVLNVTDRIAEVVPRNPLDPSDPARAVQPITDFSGYPLPGRTLLVTARWEPKRTP
jgi:iron complex outermembrane receptor protein